MGGACGTYGGHRTAYRVLWGKLKDRGHLQDLDTDERMKWKWHVDDVA